MSEGIQGDGLLSCVKRVAVGSMNEPKLAAVRSAFSAYAPDATVEGLAVDSGVSEQPVGFEEIIRGARNRAAAAVKGTPCDLAVGIEDGLVPIPLEAEQQVLSHMNIGCVAITDGKRTAIGFSSAFAYPPECWIPAVNDREPIGEIFDRLWESRGEKRPPIPSAKTVGNIGKLSHGALPRAEYARHGVLCALVAFLQPDLYGLSEGAS
jgi:inosine/xanthosine triphosphatase